MCLFFDFFSIILIPKESRYLYHEVIQALLISSETRIKVLISRSDSNLFILLGESNSFISRRIKLCLYHEVIQALLISSETRIKFLISRRESSFLFFTPYSIYCSSRLNQFPCPSAVLRNAQDEGGFDFSF